MSRLDNVVSRGDEKPERIKELVGFKGECKYCGDMGLVQIFRNMKTLALEFDRCYCLLCGQRYFIEVEDVKAWEEKQWQQKGKQ
jgi:hypothetical protein